jgi:uncharacterized glyoxalase superfamily protein PhnB
MITGAHVIVHSPQADELRAFLRDVVGYSGVDAGQGWLLFALPPAELAVHSSGSTAHELYLVCDDIDVTRDELVAKGAEFAGETTVQPWGLLAALKLPGGGTLGLYEPMHPTAI